MTDWPDDDSEARSADGSGDDEAALAEALAARLRRDAAAAPGTGAGAGEPPDAEELLAYLDGSLEPAHEARLARRLVDDPQAARALLDLADLDRAASGAAPAVPDLETRRAWRELRSRLPAAGATGDRSAAGAGQRWWAATAAALLLVSLGLGSWVWELRQAQQQPVANLRTLELAATRQGGGAADVELAPGAPLLVVLEPVASCAAYRLTLDGPGAGAPRVLPDLRRDDRGLLTLLLTGEPGRYVLRLSGCDPPRPLQEHAFRIVPEPAGG